MKTITPIFLASLLTLSLFSSEFIKAAEQAPAATINTVSLSGRQILDEVSKRHDKPYEFESQEVNLIDKAGNTETREMNRYKRELNLQETRHVLFFLAPSGIKGVSLLTWQHSATADDQWLYLPAYGKEMKRIAKGGRKNYFMGTDYTYEDLVSENRDKFNYERLPDEMLNGIKTFVIKAVATDTDLQKETGYSARKLWIAQDHFLLMQIDFFDTHQQLIKRQRNLEPVNIEGQVWRATKTEMEHFINQHKTVTTVHERSFNESAVPEKNFKENSIIEGSLLQ
ncbi:MAG: outer membrane lipoprotein-sorting protein [Methylococcaceae bacterium]